MSSTVRDRIIPFFGEVIQTISDKAKAIDMFGDNSDFMADLDHSAEEYAKRDIETLMDILHEKVVMLFDLVEYHEKNNQYEQLLQKLEGEVRNHIRIEQQLKLHIESTQAKLEDAEKARLKVTNSSKDIIEEIKNDNKALIRALKKKEEEIHRFKQDIDTKNEKLQDQEEKLLLLPKLEQKIKILENRHLLEDLSSNKENLSSTKNTSHHRPLHTDTDNPKPIKTSFNSGNDSVKRSNVSSSKSTAPSTQKYSSFTLTTSSTFDHGSKSSGRYTDRDSSMSSTQDGRDHSTSISSGVSKRRDSATGGGGASTSRPAGSSGSNTELLYIQKKLKKIQAERSSSRSRQSNTGHSIGNDSHRANGNDSSRHHHHHTGHAETERSHTYEEQISALKEQLNQTKRQLMGVGNRSRDGGHSSAVDGLITDRDYSHGQGNGIVASKKKSSGAIAAVASSATGLNRSKSFVKRGEDSSPLRGAETTTGNSKKSTNTNRTADGGNKSSASRSSSLDNLYAKKVKTSQSFSRHDSRHGGATGTSSRLLSGSTQKLDVAKYLRNFNSSSSSASNNHHSGSFRHTSYGSGRASSTMRGGASGV